MSVLTPPPSDLAPLADLRDDALTQALHAQLAAAAHSAGSLGRLGDLALRLGQILGTQAPVLREPQLLVFAADHGITKRGVTTLRVDQTWQAVDQLLAGNAVASVLARQHGLALTVVDCGVQHNFLEGFPEGVVIEGLQVRKVAWGAADSSKGAAMTRTECNLAMEHGRNLVQELPGNVVLLGESGAGNSSAASLLLAKLTGRDIAQCTGAGAGLDNAGVQAKIAVLREVMVRHARQREPLAILAAVGGLEIATMVGAVLQAAHERRVVVVDGFIATSALLVAHALQPPVLQRCIVAHCGPEPCHQALLQHLGLPSLLDLGLRQGEGTAAALAWPLLESACAILRELGG